MAMDFHSQIASIMEVMANAAVAEICKVVDDGYAVVRLEMSQSQKDNEFLRRKIKLLELQVAKYRAERMKSPDGAMNIRFPGVRLFNRQQRETLAAGPSLHSRTRSLNRGPAISQSPQKHHTINLDQDPNQEVVTTTKIETADEEDEKRELLIVKVEGAEPKESEQEVAAEGSSSTRPGADSVPLPPGGPEERSEAQRSQSEVSGSDIITLLVGRSEADCIAGPLQPELTGCDVRVGRNGELYPGDEKEKCQNVSADTALTGAHSAEAPNSEVIMIDVGEEEEFPCSGGGKLESGKTRDDQAPRSAETTARVLHETTLQRPLQDTVSLAFDTMPGPSCGSAPLHHATTIAPQPSGRFTVSLGPMVRVLHRTVPHGARIPGHRQTLGVAQQFYRRPAAPTAAPPERPYGCTSCSKRFFLEADLRSHAARHRQQKLHTCAVCGKSFVYLSQLKIHKNVHTGERPFTCPTCHRHFSNPSNVRRHQKLQH